MDVKISLKNKTPCQSSFMDIMKLPWFIKAAGESLSPNFMSLDKNPHAWVNVQHSSVGPERPPFWLPVKVRELLKNISDKSNYR